MIILDYQDRRPIYEQITEKFRTLIYQGAIAGRFQTSFCPAAGNGTVYQPEYDSESLYDTGAGGADLSGKGQREFCCRDTADSGKKQKKIFRKEFLELVRKWNTTQAMTEEELMSIGSERGYEEEQR